MGILTPYEYHSFGVSHQGNVRTHNEDAYLNAPEQRLWVVADGMGGHEAGDVASRRVVEALRSYQPSDMLGIDIDCIRSRLHQVNQALLDMAGKDSGKIIGSTVALLAIQQHYGVCLWAGDSRIYRLRNGQLKLISRDHNEAEELMDQGLSEEQAMHSPYAQSITRAIGAQTELQLETQIIEVQGNDLYLLCSDGLNKELGDKEIETILNHHPPQNSVQILLDTCLKRKGRDNITLIALRL